jgi:hypothetical protein
MVTAITDINRGINNAAAALGGMLALRRQLSGAIRASLSLIFSMIRANG